MSVLKFIAIISFCVLTGCGAACQTERTIVNALGSGLDAADVVVGDRGGENYEVASYIASGAHSLGDVAVQACETLRDGNGWTYWLLMAVEAATAIVEIIDGAGPESIVEPAPVELYRAIAAMEHELNERP